MESVYLDNAATTPLAPEAMEAMTAMMTNFGNPSSTHAVGRHAKVEVERVRKSIAKTLHCAAGEIFFTGGGTEADNTAILSAVRDMGVKRIITLPTEHHAVIHPAEFARDRYGAELIYLKVDDRGEFSLDELSERLAESEEPALVSIMHGNNEIGNLVDLVAIGTVCRQYGALFHSDTVQTVAHFHIDLSNTPVDFITCSAHKFHGPKGVGFLYVRGGVKFQPLIRGGGQERNMRAGTENTIGVVGLGAAFNLAYQSLDAEMNRLLELKSSLISGLKERVPGIEFNGLSDDLNKSLYTVTSASFPDEFGGMILFQLDMKGIAVSGGSACNSGAQKGSHVLDALRPGNTRPTVRISMGRYTTRNEIDRLLEAVDELKVALV